MTDETVIPVNFRGPRDATAYEAIMATVMRFHDEAPFIEIVGALEMAKQTLILAGVGVDASCPDLSA